MPFSLFGKEKQRPAQLLDEGWQLYSKPTTLEPVGTVFRIDPQRRRYLYDQIKVKVQRGAEAAVRIEQRVQATAGMFARFLGLDSYRGKIDARGAETLVFEVVEPMREVSTDLEIERALAPVLKSLPYRADHQYFVIRDCRSATAMTYRLTKEQLGEIGGEATLSGVIGAGANLSAGQNGLFEISQPFPERMRVMFLAEEIKPVKVGLAVGEPELGLVPVRRMLVWEED